MDCQEKFIKYLSGHSGCEISLFQGPDGLFVRKTAGRTDYNKRLRIQLAKQLAYKSTQNPNDIHAPKIYGTGVCDNIFYFDMQYLECRTMAEYMNNISDNELQRFVNLVMHELHLDDCVMMPDTNSIFQKKIKSLYQNVPGDQIYIDALQRLEKYDFSNVPYSKCHGDLTLENIFHISESARFHFDNYLWKK